MRPSTTTVLLLAVILLFGLLTRVARLDQAPPGFFFDESAIGVNAKLIATAGIDQYGTRYPVFFRALDDYKCPIYVYTTALFLKFTELTEQTVRLPAVLFGLLGIVIAFFLGREILKSDTAGLFCALLVTLSPWHFHFSRIAWEAITLIVFFPLAILLILVWLRRPSTWLGVGVGICCGLTLYTYTTAKLLMFVTVASLVLYAMRQGKDYLRKLLPAGLALAVVALPYVVVYLAQYEYINLRFQADVLPVWEIPRAYFAHFSPSFLFLKGDANPRHSSGLGMLSWYLAPLLIIGIIDALKNRSREKDILLAVILFVPVLGAFSKNYPHATRAIAFIPFLQILGVGGLMYLRRLIAERSRPVLARMVDVLLLGSFLTAFLAYGYNYFGPYRQRGMAAWRYELMPALRLAARNQRPGEPVHLISGHYSDWMFVTATGPGPIIANRERLNQHRDVYDPLDSRNKYAFLNATYVAPPVITPESVRGLWVVPVQSIDTLPLGAEILSRGERYLVFRLDPDLK